MTTAELEIHRPAALAIRPAQEMWTDKQRAALAALGIREASSADLAVFMHYCQKTGLDPFSRQIYMIARREKQGDQWVMKQTIQVGIDGFRVIRDRIAQRLGVTVEYEDTVWYDADGSAHTVWIWDYPPAACNVTVIKDGRRFPGVVRFASYAQTNRQGELVSQWRTQPDHMIEKCAEAFALRRAFPNDLGGIYLEDEVPPMPADAERPANGRVTAQEITRRRNGAPKDASSPADSSPSPGASVPHPPADAAGEDAQPDPDRPPARASSGQVGIIHKHFTRLGYNPDSPDDRQSRLRVTAILAQVDDLDSSSQLDQDQAARVIRWLEKCADGAALELLLAEGEVTDE